MLLLLLLMSILLLSLPSDANTAFSFVAAIFAVDIVTLLCCHCHSIVFAAANIMTAIIASVVFNGTSLKAPLYLIKSVNLLSVKDCNVLLHCEGWHRSVQCQIFDA